MTVFIDVNKLNKKRYNIKKPGDYIAFMYNFSGDIIFDIQSERVNLQVYGLYVGINKDTFSLNTTQRHVSPNSQSNLLVKGVFSDESKFRYCGLIRIEKTAHQTQAYQKNQNLKLSPFTFVESDPFLEILNKNVKCGHGSSTGKLNEDELFYLYSRGVKSADARSLLIQGFLNEVLNKVREKNPKFRLPKIPSKFN